MKNLLAGAGISYSEKEINSVGNEYVPDQGSRIIPKDITETDAKVFFSMFWGRTDVYSKRTIKKNLQGKSIIIHNAITSGKMAAQELPEVR